DCCSTRLESKEGVKERDLLRGEVVRDLFLRGRGLVDITAAQPGKSSWGDSINGGIFTRSLCWLLTRPRGQLDTNGEGMVSGTEFYPALRDQTNSRFATWSKYMKSRGESIDDRTQLPRDYALPRTTYAVLSITNSTDKPLRYTYRWIGETKWQTQVIAA